MTRLILGTDGRDRLKVEVVPRGRDPYDVASDLDFELWTVRGPAEVRQFAHRLLGLADAIEAGATLHGQQRFP